MLHSFNTKDKSVSFTNRKAVDAPTWTLEKIGFDLSRLLLLMRFSVLCRCTATSMLVKQLNLEEFLTKMPSRMLPAEAILCHWRWTIFSQNSSIANEKWSEAVKTADPRHQRYHSTPSSSISIPIFFRFSGWDVQTTISPNVSSPSHLQVTYLSIATSPGRFPPLWVPVYNLMYVQSFHLNDDNMLAVLIYAIRHIPGIKQSALSPAFPLLSSLAGS